MDQLERLMLEETFPPGPATSAPDTTRLSDIPDQQGLRKQETIRNKPTADTA